MQPGAADLSICTKTTPPLPTLPPRPSLCRTAATTKLPPPRRLHQAAKTACRHHCRHNAAAIATIALPLPSCCHAAAATTAPPPSAAAAVPSPSCHHPYCRHRHPAVALPAHPRCHSRHPAAAAAPPLSCHCRTAHHRQHHRIAVALAVLALFVAALIPCLPVGCRIDASTSHHLPPLCTLLSFLPPPPPPLSCSTAGCCVNASASRSLSPLVRCCSPHHCLLLLFLGGGPRHRRCR